MTSPSSEPGKSPTESSSWPPAKSLSKSPSKSRSASELPTPPSTSPNHSPQDGAGEVQDEDTLENLQDGNNARARAVITGNEPLRDFGLSHRGSEDFVWLVPASRPLFAVSTQDPVPASPLPQPILPPRQRDAAPPAPYPRPTMSQGIWPSPNVVHGQDPDARRSFLTTNGQQFLSGGQIFATLQHQGRVVPSDTTSHKALQAASLPRKTQAITYDTLWGKIEPFRKGTGETGSHQEKAPKKSRSDRMRPDQLQKVLDEDAREGSAAEGHNPDVCRQPSGESHEQAPEERLDVRKSKSVIQERSNQTHSIDLGENVVNVSHGDSVHMEVVPESPKWARAEPEVPDEIESVKEGYQDPAAIKGEKVGVKAKAEEESPIPDPSEHLVPIKR